MNVDYDTGLSLTLTQTIPYGLSLTSASILLVSVFTIGAAANAGRAMIMKISGGLLSSLLCRSSDMWTGQRIVTRLRENMYGAALRQEVEFVEKGEGDVLSRLSSDTYIVGERYEFLPYLLLLETDPLIT
jgi:putative ABC transport system ATP-binding protein